jgi:small-conductance mechanosensitive channel
MSENRLLGELGNLLLSFKAGLFRILPNLILAVVVLIVGIFIAKLFRAIIIRLVTRIDRFVPNKKIQDRLRRYLSEKPIGKVIGGIVFWIVVFFFLAAGTEILGLPVITTWLSSITGYLPKILAAVLIGAAGLIGAIVVRDIITTISASAGILFGNTLGKLAQVTIILITILIAIEQIGINVSILISLITIIIGAIIFGAAFAFGMGAKDSVNNILSSYYLQKRYKVGDQIEIDGKKGKIIEITSTSVVLESSDEQILIPAKKFSEVVSVLRNGEN